MLPKKDNKIPRYVNLITNLNLLDCELGFPSGSDSKESTSNAGDLGLIPGTGRSHGRGHSNPLQYSCLQNPMDRGAWQAMVAKEGCKRVAKELNTT